MRPFNLLRYVRENLPNDLAAVSRGPRAAIFPHLTPAEKALIHCYTRDEGEPTPGLEEVLAKLPPYTGQVYSGQYLAPDTLAAIRQALQQGRSLHWPAFLSTTSFAPIAMMFLRTSEKNTLLLIESRTGRLIEKISYYGPHGAVPGQNEREVLFAPGGRFAVVALEPADGYTRVTLREV